MQSANQNATVSNKSILDTSIRNELTKDDFLKSMHCLASLLEESLVISPKKHKKKLGMITSAIAENDDSFAAGMIGV